MERPSIKDNLRYQQMTVREGEYVPDAGIVEYPSDDPFKRLVTSTAVRDLKFDENYPYEDNSLGFKIQRAFAYFLALDLFYIVNKLRYGVRFEGRENLKKYREAFRNGLVAVSNHCYRWDGMAIAEALRHRLWVPMYSRHFNSKDYWYMRYFGGIPIPDNYGGLKKFNEAFDNINRKKGWILVFPESCNWHFYKPLKPFKKGALTMAYKYNIPVLPICIAYRERTGIHKLFDKPEIPLITVRIGEPIFPDCSNNRKDEVDRLIRESHAAVCNLAGIVNNPWPPIWDE